MTSLNAAEDDVDEDDDGGNDGDDAATSSDLSSEFWPTAAAVDFEGVREEPLLVIATRYWTRGGLAGGSSSLTRESWGLREAGRWR